ncbi:MAG TPA: hypothetical protein PK640_14715, partial [Verrucomicrobiota bacterium]|nr:hypothetical protein [Verrucomicrobiota bacterium]
ERARFPAPGAIPIPILARVGRLTLSPGQVDKAGQASSGFMLAFQAFPTIIFLSALVSLFSVPPACQLGQCVANAVPQSP